MARVRGEKKKKKSEFLIEAVTHFESSRVRNGPESGQICDLRARQGGRAPGGGDVVAALGPRRGRAGVSSELPPSLRWFGEGRGVPSWEAGRISKQAANEAARPWRFLFVSFEAGWAHPSLRTAGSLCGEPGSCPIPLLTPKQSQMASGAGPIVGCSVSCSVSVAGVLEPLTWEKLLFFVFFFPSCCT